MLNCASYQEELSAYLDGELSKEELEKVQEHLQNCQQCRSALEDLKELQQMVGAPVEEPYPPYLTTKIRQRLDSEATPAVHSFDHLVEKIRGWLLGNGKVIYTLVSMGLAGIVLVVVFSGRFINTGLHSYGGAELYDTTVAEQNSALPPMGKAAMPQRSMENMVAQDGLAVAGNNGSASMPEGQRNSRGGQQKLIVTVNMNLAVKGVEGAFRSMQQEAVLYGGYVESSGQQAGAPGSKELMNANLTMRIPANRLEAFLAKTEGLGRVLNIQRSSQDVTLQYTDQVARLSNLKVQEKRLLDLYNKAQKMDEILKIEEKLSQVRGDIESLTAQVKLLTNQTDYATVNVALEKDVAAGVQTDKAGFGQRLKVAFYEGINEVIGVVQELSLALVYNVVPLVIFVATIFAGFKSYRKRKA